MLRNFAKSENYDTSLKIGFKKFKRNFANSGKYFFVFR
jgi:hypothetical protein